MQLLPGALRLLRHLSAKVGAGGGCGCAWLQSIAMVWPWLPHLLLPRLSENAVSSRHPTDACTPMCASAPQGVPWAIATSTPRATFNAKMANRPELRDLMRFVVGDGWWGAVMGACA